MIFALKSIKKNPIQFLILGLIFVISICLFYVFRFDPHSQRRTIYVTSILYLFWSLYHHYRQGDLHFSIIVEYIIFAFLALFVATFTLF